MPFRKYKKITALDLLTFGGVFVVFVIYFAYIVVALKNIVGNKDDLTATFNIIAQLATSGAFIFAVYQYRKNGEKDKQVIIASEAKMIIDRMVRASVNLKDSAEPMDRAINNFTSLMSNLGTDFEVLYDSLHDELHKTMVRMRWQDMHYNHLSPALKSLTVDMLFEDLNLEKDFKGYSFTDADFDNEVLKSNNSIREFKRTELILNNMSIGEEIVDNINNLFLFEHYFFNKERTGDLMQGLLSQLSFESSAPLLAVIWAKQKCKIS
ncbi:hypothetical protein LCL85_00325 [Vibrio alginolyticus]|nr:hypothetical protein [Vibrio alginolyticus]